ncbi:MAG: efflux RND transporter permease subunit [Bryobacterales bacterium]|nr:efflux RND transporter permease subunit [Bryobacterales bacterium]MBV9397918.1 efflux RND transporter permease subunit [Bryobacterales bacterium]
MSRFSIRNPYFIIVICLALMVIGITSVARMPVDLFPTINLPEVVVATFYSGMPPEDIETDITNPLERFFTLASGIDHMESRSMLGVSMIKVFFQPGTNADADVTQLSNLALADLKRLPPGTLPPVVLKFDASSLPVCLVTLKGEGLTETQLHDIGQFTIRNQIAVVQGAEIPPPFGGEYRQVMVYVDPIKLLSRQLSPMDVVTALNNSNLILPAGDVKMGPYDYYVYSNSLVKKIEELNNVPIRTVGDRAVTIGDIGEAKDSHQIQYNIVRVDGQRSVYLPIMKQGGDTNTIQVVNGIRDMLPKLFDIPKQLQRNVVFDQSAFVKDAMRTLLDEGMIGLALTSLMILIFLGSLRATVAVFLSIPLSAVATFVILYLIGSTVNTMILGGLALAFSRIIDNSVISLENIYRHLEMGSSPEKAAMEGGSEVSLAVLAATLTTVVVFFPVTFLYGVSKFLFSALALAVVISLFASYLVAMTVIPLFCARFLKRVHGVHEQAHSSGGFNAWFTSGFQALLNGYEWAVRRALRWPALTVLGLLGIFIGSLTIYPKLGLAFFPRTDAGQFTINLKVPTGARIESSEDYVRKVEDIIRNTVDPADFKMLVSNIGIVPDFSALYTTNAGPYTATIQAELNDGHKVGSFEYMDRVRRAIASKYPELRTFFSSGSMVDAILNMGAPAPIDVQVSSRDLDKAYSVAQDLSARIRRILGVGEVYVPQDMNYPAVRLKIDRVHAAELGVSQKEIVDNVITALNSNTMIAPNYWVDHQTGNDYFLSVQYYENGKSAIHNFTDLQQIPLRGNAEPAKAGGIDGNRSFTSTQGGRATRPITVLSNVADLEFTQSPTEIDHYQIQRIADVYVTPAAEDLGKVASQIKELLKNYPSNVRINLRGMVQQMNDSFYSFAIGLSLSVILLFLILVAQFRSFKDPLLIMLAIPMGFIGVLAVLPLTHTTLNVMSLMGVLMLVGISASNSILIVEFAHRLEEQGQSVQDAIITSCRVRLRPILMTSLATIIGMIPMALKLGTGSEQYAPLARAIIGGLTVSVLLTVFIVPAAYLLVYRNKPAPVRP